MDLFENWLKNCFSRIIWGNTFSYFAIKFGVRQGKLGLVASLIAIYLDDIPIAPSLVPRSFIVHYADDILLIAPSVYEVFLNYKGCLKIANVH